MGTYGQDWASYQSPAPSVTGLSFVFVKATEGTGYVNPRRAAQVAYARLHKLVVGHYHYPHMAADPAAEVSRFLEVAAPQAGDILVLDWEGYDAANRGVPFATQVAYKGRWLALVRAAMPHLQIGTYCNTDYLARDPKGVYGDFLWIATANRPVGQPGISHQWLFHQYGASGVDKDYCPLSAAELAAWAHAKEDDVNLADKATAKKGVWTDTDQTATVSDWLTLGNLKAGAAADGVKAVEAKVDALDAKVSKLAVGGVNLDLLATKVADLLAARLKS